MRTNLSCFKSVPVFFLLLAINSCEKFFKPEEFYLSNIKSKAELNEAIEGIRYNFKNQVYNKNIDYFGDDLFVQLSGSQGTPVQTYEFYEAFFRNAPCGRGRENGISIQSWNQIYKLLGSINNVLNQFDLKDVNDKDTRELLGECFFYRAWIYYKLTRIYGRIPIIDNPDVNYSVYRYSYSEVYKFIEEDLFNALEHLPVKNITSRIPYETPNQGIVKAVLGEVYLSWAGFPIKDESKYILAAKFTKELIDSADDYGYELLPDFEDLWNKKTYYNNEAILCFYLRQSDDNYKTIYYGKLIPLNQDYGFNAIGLDKNTALMLQSNPIPEIEFYNTYPKGYRKNVTFFTRIYVYPIKWQVIDTGYFDVEKSACNCRAAYRKFFIDTLILQPDPSQYSSFEYYDLKGCPKVYMLRYAQTMLTYAEASARSGNLNEKSYECINRIRRRANKLPLDSPSIYDLTPGLSPEAFADSVVQERAWELAGEPGHRWFDMVRLGIVEKVFASRNPDDGGPFEYTENDKYFFPIPEHDIDLNPNLGK